MNWYAKYKISKTENELLRFAVYISREEFERRLEKIGWNLENKNPGDYIAFSPDGKTKLTIVSEHNWEKSWRKAKQHLRAQNQDLDFLFDSAFIIPKEFNVSTQKIEKTKEKEIKIVPFIQLNTNNMQAKHNDDFVDIIDIDYTNRQVLLEDETILTFQSPSSMIEVRIK